MPQDREPNYEPDPVFVDRLVMATTVLLVVILAVLMLGLLSIFLFWLASVV